MSGVIGIGDDPSEIWLVAGWAFRSFLGSVAEVKSEDNDLVQEIRQSEAMHGLHLDVIAEENPELFRRVMTAVEQVAAEVVEGKHPARAPSGILLPNEDQEMYQEAVAGLLRMIRAC